MLVATQRMPESPLECAPCAQRGVERFIVHGTTEGKVYDEVFSLHVQDNAIVYGARKGRKLYRVTRRRDRAA